MSADAKFTLTGLALVFLVFAGFVLIIRGNMARDERECRKLLALTHSSRDTILVLASRQSCGEYIR